MMAIGDEVKAQQGVRNGAEIARRGFSLDG